MALSGAARTRQTVTCGSGLDRHCSGSFLVEGTMFCQLLLCHLVYSLLTEVTPADRARLRASHLEGYSVLLTTYNYHD